MTTAANARFERAFSRHFAALSAAPQFRTDSEGRQVRVFTKDAPLSRDTVRSFYLNMRGFDIEEGLMELGYNGMRFQIEQGYIVEDAFVKGQYWITTKAAANYDLPRPRLAASGAICKFVEA